jgi:histone deacetylase 1/2
LVLTQFRVPFEAIQCDNGREFDNSLIDSFAHRHGIALRFSCPYTSQQNGKPEHIIRTLNDITRTLLIQASMPPRFWVEALHTAVMLHKAAF